MGFSKVKLDLNWIIFNHCVGITFNNRVKHYSGLIEQHKSSLNEMWKTVNKMLNRGTAATTISSLIVS